MDRLFRAKKNQIKMLKVRGFNIESEELLLNLSPKEIGAYYEEISKTQNTSVRKAMSKIYLKDDIKLLVMYIGDSTGKSSQLGVSSIHSFIEEFTQNKCQEGIIISPFEPTKDAIEELKGMTQKLIQFFLEIELNYDIMSHFLNQKFEVLSPEQATEFFKINHLKPSQMPIIKNYDPVAKYLGVTSGMVLKEYNVTLSGETIVDEYITYSIIQ
jgi:DNA-directed RNA polymerases I, II, and III subunit RPABC1